jgi:hypothetical protein
LLPPAAQAPDDPALPADRPSSPPATPTTAGAASPKVPQPSTTAGDGRSGDTHDVPTTRGPDASPSRGS